mmetsp:Transcript_19883/g.59205  ORF Transcript_19883/g.59205 Transcript_19883/m.59205 type:complete len:200 (-) Transcript_19883:13-612(-)
MISRVLVCTISSTFAFAPPRPALIHRTRAKPLQTLSSIGGFLQEHTFLEGVAVAIAGRIVINEVRRKVEKPVMDEVGRRVASGLKPEPAEVSAESWAKLAGCIVLDLLGDSSELIPFLGEFTDVGFAPAEAALLKALFNSNAIAAFGFAEEILPFTDVIPTFTLSWCLATLWPTTDLAKKLVPEAAAKNTLLPAETKSR